MERQKPTFRPPMRIRIRQSIERTFGRVFGALKLVMLLVIVVAGYFGLSYGYSRINEKKDLQAEASRQGRLVEAGGAKVFVQSESAGHKLPVLLVNGGASWSGTWFDVLPVLKRAGHPIIVVDLPPFGLADRGQGIDTTRAAQAARLKAVLDGLKVPKAIVVGHSEGAGDALELALREPDTVDRLVLMNGRLEIGRTGDRLDSPWCEATQDGVVRNVLMSSSLTSPLWDRMYLKSLVSNADLVTRDLAGVFRRPLQIEGTSDALAQWLYRDYCLSDPAWSRDEARVRELGAPLGIVWGMSDSVAPPAIAQRLHGLLPKSTLTMVPGAGHLPHIEAKEAFEKALLEAMKLKTDVAVSPASNPGPARPAGASPLQRVRSN